MKILIMHIKKLANILFVPILLLTVVNCGGGGGGGGGGSTTTTPTPTVTGTVTWDSPTINMDGSCLTDLTGYKLYYGVTSRAGDSAFSYDDSVTIPLDDSNLDCQEDQSSGEPVTGCGFKKLCGYTASLSIPGLTTGDTYYGAVTAYDASDFEGDYSAEVTKTVD